MRFLTAVPGVATGEIKMIAALPYWQSGPYPVNLIGREGRRDEGRDGGMELDSLTAKTTNKFLQSSRGDNAQLPARS